MFKKFTALALVLGTLSVFTTNADAAKVGEAAPAFNTMGTNGEAVTLEQFKDKIVVLEWSNHECPFVVKHYESGNMQALQKKLAGDDLVWLTIVSSADGKQGNVSAEDANKITADSGAMPSHKILDPSGEIGKSYGAKTTPHMYVIDKHGVLAYAGAIDDHSTWKQDGLKDANNYVTAAVSALREDQPIEVSETAPYGCSVKY